MKENTLYRAGIFVGICVLMAATLISLMGTKTATAMAPYGIPATVGTSSTMTIGPSTAYNSKLGDYMGSTTNETAFLCGSRIVSTTGGAIMMAYASLASTTLSGSVGNYQAASTTVAYDSGLYGCGYWTFYAYATTTIVVTQTR